MTIALEWRDLEIDIVTHLEMKFTAATVGICLLARLSNAKIFTDNFHLILGILYLIRAKEGPFPGFGPIDGGPTSLSVEGFEGRHFDTCLITIVIGELRKR
jgi:hypothetical protein